MATTSGSGTAANGNERPHNDGPSTDASLNVRAKPPRRGGGRLWGVVAIVAAVAVAVTLWLAYGARNRETGAPGAARPADTVTIGLKLPPTNLDIRNQAGAALDQVLIGNVY